MEYAINNTQPNANSTTLPKLSHHLVDEARYNLLRAIAYMNEKEQLEVIDACSFGDKAHIKDKRKSGEPYITHPVAVAQILAELGLGPRAVAVDAGRGVRSPLAATSPRVAPRLTTTGRTAGPPDAPATTAVAPEVAVSGRPRRG